MANADRNTKLTVGVLSLMAYAGISAQFQPYKRPSDDVLWNSCLYSLFLTLYIGQLQASLAAVGCSSRQGGWVNVRRCSRVLAICTRAFSSLLIDCPHCERCGCWQVVKANPLGEGATTVLLSCSALLPYITLAGTTWYAVRKVIAARGDPTGGARVVPVNDGVLAAGPGSVSIHAAADDSKQED